MAFLLAGLPGEGGPFLGSTGDCTCLRVRRFSRGKKKRVHRHELREADRPSTSEFRYLL